jgi:hypothetical protein
MPQREALVADHRLRKVHQRLQDRRPVREQEIAVGDVAIRLLDDVEALLELLGQRVTIGLFDAGHAVSPVSDRHPEVAAQRPSKDDRPNHANA